MPSRHISFGPSSGCAPDYPASADFCTSIGSPCGEPSPTQAETQISQGKTRDLQLHIPAAYTRAQFRMTYAVWTSCAASPLSGPCASYAIRVPRAGAAHSTSFRLRLTAETLVVPVGVPGHRGLRGVLHPSGHILLRFPSAVRSARQGASRHAWRTHKNTARQVTQRAVGKKRENVDRTAVCLK